jgi:hypothetical protein
MSRQDLLSRARRGLAHILSPDEEVKAPARKARPAADPNDGLDDSANFAARLKKLLADGMPGATGSGHVCQIGFGKIKARFGASWERVADRAERIARNTIERYLTRGDIYGALEGPAYVIVFAQLPEEKAKTKCLLIAQEIAKALVGENGADVLEVKSGAISADGSYSVQEMAIDDRLLQSLTAMEQIEVPDQSGDPEPASARQAGEATQSSAAPRATAGPSDQFANLRLSYRPLWDRARNVVSTYVCTGRLPSSDGAWRDGPAATQGNPAARGQFDEVVVMRALDHLVDLVREKRVALIAIPLHFETLGGSARRRRITQLLAERVAAAERKLLLIEIDGVPAGALQSRLVDIIAPLTSNCRAVMLRLPLDTADFTVFKACGAKALGVDIAGHMSSETVLMQHMNRFARSARERAGLPAYVLGADSSSLAVAALGAGFDYIGGDAIAKRVEDPRGLVEFSAANIFTGANG